MRLIAIFSLMFVLVACTPNETDTDAPISYWLASDTSQSDDSIEIGCETFLTPIETETAQSDDAAQNIEQALDALFTNSADAPYRNWWQPYSMSINEITVDDTQFAEISLSGDFLLIGTCGDAEIEAQILYTIFANSTIETARIMIDGENLAQTVDMSGQSDENTIFTRDDVAIPN